MAEWDAFIEDQFSKAFGRIVQNAASKVKKILDESGFAETEGLKDYEVIVQANDEGFEIVIMVEADAVAPESIDKFKVETNATNRSRIQEVKGRGDAKAFRETYMMSPRGRPERIAGMRDARLKLKPKLKPARTAFKTSRERLRNPKVKTSSDRYVQHEFAATMPRGLSVEDGKLRISMQRGIRNTSRKVIYPKGNFQGIMNKIVEELNSLVANELSKNLGQIIQSII